MNTNGEKRGFTEDEARAMVLQYYFKPMFEAEVLLKMVKRTAGNKNADQEIEALKVVFLSDISACLKELLRGQDKGEQD